MSMLDTIKYYTDLATNDDVTWGEFAGQVAGDALATATEAAAEAVAYATEDDAPVTPPEKQAIPSLPADESSSNFIAENECLDTEGQALVNSVKPAETSWWSYADASAMLSDAWSSVTSTVKEYIPEGLKPYIYGDESESSAVAADESSESWYSPIVAMAKSVESYVFGEDSQTSPVVASSFNSAESVYVATPDESVCDDVPVATHKEAAPQAQNARTAAPQAPVVFIPDFAEPVSSTSAYTTSASLALSPTEGADTFTSDQCIVPVMFTSASEVVTSELSDSVALEAEAAVAVPAAAQSQAAAATSTAPVETLTAQAQTTQVLMASTAESSDTSFVPAFGSSQSYYLTLDTAAAQFGAQWIHSAGSVISGTAASIIDDGQSLMAIAQSENANLLFGANHSFAPAANNAQAMDLTVRDGNVTHSSFATGATALPMSEVALFSAYSSVAQAAAASLKNSSEILHVQQAARSGVSSVLPSPFPMVFWNGLATMIGQNKEQAQVVAELTRPLVAVESQGQMSGGSDSDHPGRQNEAESLAFDEAAPIVNSASVQTSVPSAEQNWDAPFVPEVRDVFVGA